MDRITNQSIDSDPYGNYTDYTESKKKIRKMDVMKE